MRLQKRAIPLRKADRPSRLRALSVGLATAKPAGTARLIFVELAPVAIMDARSVAGAYFDK
jgi:hypothetical protein